MLRFLFCAGLFSAVLSLGLAGNSTVALGAKGSKPVPLPEVTAAGLWEVMTTVPTPTNAAGPGPRR